MKSKVTAFVKDAHRGLDELSEGLKNIEKQVKEIADYFCEDPKKLKIEELFSELLAFVRTYEAAVEVRKEKRGVERKIRERILNKIKGPGFGGYVSITLCSIYTWVLREGGAIKGEG